MQFFKSEKVLVYHKGVCLKINGKQCVKLRNGYIKLNNNSKQLAVPFKIYADFESVLNGNASYTEKYQEHIPCSFAYKVVCIDDKCSKPVALYRGKGTVNKFITAILSEYEYCRSVIKKHFKKNLVMTVEVKKI